MSNGPFAEAVRAARYGLAVPWSHTVEAFDGLARLAERVDQLRRGRTLTWSTGRLEWGGEQPIVRHCLIVGVVAEDKVVLDLRLLVQGEPLAAVLAAVEAAAGASGRAPPAAA